MGIGPTGVIAERSPTLGIIGSRYRGWLSLRNYVGKHLQSPLALWRLEEQCYGVCSSICIQLPSDRCKTRMGFTSVDGGFDFYAGGRMPISHTPAPPCCLERSHDHKTLLWVGRRSPELEPAVQRREVIGQSASQTVQADTGVQVLLVDDHAKIRQGLRSVLETYSDICVVGEACDGVEAIAQAARLCPSVVVIDINMPKMSGIDATSIIKTRHPEMVVIGLSSTHPLKMTKPCEGRVAALLLTKEAAVEQLHVCIHEAMQGRRP